MFVRSLSLGVAAATLLTAGVQAADLIIPTTPQPIYEAAGFDWEGLYVGVRAGGQFVQGGTYIGSVANTTSGVIGGAVGVNFVPMDPILLGVEVTGDYIWGGATHSAEFYANLRAGAVLTDSVLVYAIGGVGVKSTSTLAAGTHGIYQVGAGVELAVTDAITVRGEVVGQGDFEHAAGDQFFEAAKATVGVYYHF